MEENNNKRGFVNKFNSFDLWFTKFIRSSQVQNVVAVLMFLFIIQMFYKLGRILLSSFDVDPEVAYFERQAFYFNTFSTIGYTAIFLFVNFYRITTTPDLELKILKFSQKLYSKETAKLCFEPLLADWKKEYEEAIVAKRIWRAMVVSIRYANAFIVVLIQQSWVGRFFDFFQRIFK